MQEKRPVAYASHLLKPNELKYAQIEKELLGIVFGLERCHQFTYGGNITMETDYKTLESIAHKPLYLAPNILNN